jgi:hypothetical protein
MTDYIIGIAINLFLACLTFAIALLHYRATVATPQRLRTLQYRLFAIRDRAVRMVAEGVASEDDPRFQKWYGVINRSACSGVVGQVSNGLTFSLRLLRNSRPPTAEEEKEFTSLPESLKQLIVDYGRTVLSICWDGSWVLRTLVWLGQRFVRVGLWLKRRRPLEAKRYAEWRQFAQHHAGAAVG